MNESLTRELEHVLRYAPLPKGTWVADTKGPTESGRAPWQGRRPGRLRVYWR